MSLERTLSIIKPDAMMSKQSGKILNFIEEKGFKISAQKKIRLTKKQAEGFYNVHKERPFFPELVEFMTSGPILVQVLEANNAVNKYRDIMGTTNPEEAKNDTIRSLYGKDIQCNAVHGSDSLENAKIEISFFFNQLELLT